MSEPTPTRSPPGRWALVVPAVLAGVALDVGASMFGDTPDTRESTVVIASYFTRHRTDVFVGTVIVTAAFMVFGGVSMVVARRIEVGGGLLIAQLVRATATITLTIYLVTIPLLYNALSYVIGTEAPEMAKGIFELTLVASTVIAWPLAALMILAGVGLRRTSAGRSWFCWSSVALGSVCAVAAVAFARSGYFSPDVQQQVVFTVVTVWLVTVGFGQRPLAPSVNLVDSIPPGGILKS